MVVGLRDNIGVKVSIILDATRVWLLCCAVGNINAVVDVTITVEDGNDVDDNNLGLVGVVCVIC